MKKLPKSTQPSRILVTLMLAALLIGACSNTAPAPQATGSTVAPAGNAPTATLPVLDPTATSGSQAAPTAGTAVLVVACEAQASWIRNFNPFLGDSRFLTINGIHEPLMVYNSLKGKLVPWLAIGYAWSDDNKKLTFTLRDGVQWSDGQPFTARDVAFTFNMFKQQAGLQGPASRVMSGETGYVDAVNAPDDTSVEFTFKEVFAPGLYDIVNQNIVPEHIWKNVTDATKYTNENPVGTGPFTDVRVFQSLVYEIGKNPNYWQLGKPQIEAIRCPALPSSDAATLALVNGEIDWGANFIPDIEKVYVAKNPEHFGYWFPAIGGTVMLYLNTTRAPFDDPNVRKAISMALNREQIVSVAIYDYTEAADVTGLTDAYPNYKVADPASLGDWTTFDAQKANVMLDAAGLAKGANGIRARPDGTPLQYDINVVSGWSDWISTCQIIAQNLKAIGIEATVKSYDFGAWFDRVQKGDFDISIGWSSTGPTPYDYYRDQMSQQSFKPLGEDSPANWHRYVSPKADELLNQFVSTADPAQQKHIAEQLQRTFAEEAPAIPLFPGLGWYQYNTTRFAGFPTQDNPYAHGSPWGQGAPEQLIVMTTVKPR
jgi:peptide/nickel transport system substrate-binding protein